jgi:hypothetical protein
MKENIGGTGFQPVLAACWVRLTHQQCDKRFLIFPDFWRARRVLPHSSQNLLFPKQFCPLDPARAAKPEL